MLPIEKGAKRKRVVPIEKGAKRKRVVPIEKEAKRKKVVQIIPVTVFFSDMQQILNHERFNLNILLFSNIPFSK